MTNSQALITDLQVKSLKGLKFAVPGGYVLGSGWGLWDASSEGWVSMGGVFETQKGNFPAPYCPKGGKKALEEIAKTGLFAGYAIVRHF
jgi:hypothetical protein